MKRNILMTIILPLFPIACIEKTANSNIPLHTTQMINTMPAAVNDISLPAGFKRRCVDKGRVAGTRCNGNGHGIEQQRKNYLFAGAKLYAGPKYPHPKRPDGCGIESLVRSKN